MNSQKIDFCDNFCFFSKPLAISHKTKRRTLFIDPSEPQAVIINLFSRGGVEAPNILKAWRRR